MAYHRGEIYIWQGDDGLHLWAKRGYDEWDQMGWACGDGDERQPGYEKASGVCIPAGVAGEFAAMRFAEMLADGSLFGVMERAARVGNFGAATLGKNLAALKEALMPVKIKPWRHDEPFPPFSDELERIVASGVCDAQTLLYFPSGYYFELVEGRLQKMHLPGGDTHGSLTARFSFEVGLHVRKRELGRCYAANTGFWLARNPDTVLAPDFAYVSKERRDEPATHGFVAVAPDLVLETRMPSDDSDMVAAKMRLWLSFGVRLGLDLDPTDGVLTVYREGEAEPQTLIAADTLDGGDVLPGFMLSVSDLFAPW